MREVARRKRGDGPIDEMRRGGKMQESLHKWHGICNIVFKASPSISYDDVL